MMENSEILVRLMIAVIYGTILGLETETRNKETDGKPEKSRLGGIRTYTILSLIGAIAGILYNQNERILVYITFIAIIGLVISAYILNVQQEKAFGLTTEVAIFITFLLGFLSTSGLIDVIITLVVLVLLTFFLSRKRGFGYFFANIKHSELEDVAKLGILSVVALPLLPDVDYNLGEIFQMFGQTNIDFLREYSDIFIINPFKMWGIVIIISAINVIGYFLRKIFGNSKGLIITAIIGGIVSSTSSLVAFANKSKTEGSHVQVRRLAAASILAHSASLPAVLLLISITSTELSIKLIPAVLSISLIGFIYGFILMLNKKALVEEKIEIEYEPFSISPALKFVATIIIITVFLQIIQKLEFPIVTVVLTAISGITGMDASAIAIGTLAKENQLSIVFAGTLLLATNAVNTFTKIVMSKMFGSPHFSKIYVVGLLLTLIGTLVFFLDYIF